MSPVLKAESPGSTPVVLLGKAMHRRDSRLEIIIANDAHASPEVADCEDALADALKELRLGEAGQEQTQAMLAAVSSGAWLEVERFLLCLLEPHLLENISL